MKHLTLLMTLAVLLCLPASADRNVQQQLNDLKLEPTVRQTQEAALRYFRVNLSTVESMRTRASWKALMPVTEVQGAYSDSTVDETTQNFEKFLDGQNWLIKGAGGTAYEVRGKLTWNLPSLVFNPEELDVASLAGLMEGILKESTRLYFMRRRLQVDMILTPPTDRASLLSKQLRLEELTGLIDAMTGGWFQQELTRRRGRAQLMKRKQKQAAAPAPPAKAPASPPTVMRK